MEKGVKVLSIICFLSQTSPTFSSPIYEEKNLEMVSFKSVEVC